MSLQARDAGGAKQCADALRRLLDYRRTALLHRRKIETHGADLHTMHGELVLRAVEQLRGLEQRLRGNAPGVQTGPTEGVRAVAVAPLVDAGDLQFVLAGANRARIARRAAADDDDVVFLGH